MALADFEQTLTKFLVRNNIRWNQAKKKWSKQFRPTVKVVFVKDETTSTLPQKDNPNFPYLYPFYKKENARGYYSNIQTGWELGPFIIEYDEREHENDPPKIVRRCIHCKNSIDVVNSRTNKSKRFCDNNCKQEYFQIKKKFKDLEKDGIEGIFWQSKKEKPDETNSNYFKPERKDMLLKFRDTPLDMSQTENTAHLTKYSPRGKKITNQSKKN